MLKKIWYVYGAGGLGRECLDIINNDKNFLSSDYEIRFLDDQPKEKYINGIKVEKYNDFVPNSLVTIAVGEPTLREVLYNKIMQTSLKLTSAIHKSSFISSSSNISKGVIIAPFCSIQSNCCIRINSLINSMSIIGHDCKVGPHSVISSKVNLGGAVAVGKLSFIGMGVSIKEKVKIGSKSVVSMTSAVHHNIPNNVIVVGSPARIAKKNNGSMIFNRGKYDK